MALLEVRNLTKTFGDRTVLDGVSFTLEEGDAKVIMGPSGCGKSTLLRCLNRLIEPTSGEIIFDGGRYSTGVPSARCAAGSASCSRISRSIGICRCSTM